MWRRFNFIRRACSTSSSSATSASASSTSKPAAAAASASGGNLYARLLEQHPIKVKCLSSGVIMGSGDLACQWLTKCAKTEEAAAAGREEEAQAEAGFDLWRTAKFGIMGSIIIGPVLHHWYGFLIRQIPGATTAAAVKRLLVDQTCFAPVFIPVFFTGLQFLDGNFNRGDIQAKLEADYADTLVANWKLWVPAMFVNFKFVPTKYQVLFSNAVGFFWNIFLSFQSFKEHSSGGSASQVVEVKQA